MNGFINLLKPPGMTSSDAVLAVRKLLPRKTPVGHGGTLDPDAAGVLPICVGKATRLFDYIIDKNKTYIGELCLGVSTDTDDASGRVLSHSEVNAKKADIERVLPSFTGIITQTPPAYSAIKIGGEPLYKKARNGEEITVSPRSVRVESIEILDRTADNKWLLKIVCGKGVYIRSLMRDIGIALGIPAHMSFLLRSQSGSMSAENALTLNELKALADIADAVMPLDSMLGAYPRVTVKHEMRKNVINGQTILRSRIVSKDGEAGDNVRVYVENEFAGMGFINEDGGVNIKVMLLEQP